MAKSFYKGRHFMFTKVNEMSMLFVQLRNNVKKSKKGTWQNTLCGKILDLKT